MRKLLLAWFVLVVSSVCAHAQVGNLCRTSPAGAVSSACASEAFVTQSRGTLTPVAFSTLAACSSSTAGQTADVNDSTTNTFGATITGSGSYHVLAYCNGTNWTVAGGGLPVTGWRVATGTDSILTSDCFKTVVLTNNTFYSETLPAASGFPDGCKVKVKNGDSYSGIGTGRGKKLVGFPSDLFCILYPGQVSEVQKVNGSWTTTLNPYRWVIPGPTLFQNRTSGSDSCDADGLAAGSGAFQTLSFAILVQYQKIDNQNASPIIYLDIAGNVAGRTLDECVTAQGQLIGINVGFIYGYGGSAVWNTSGVCAAFTIADNAEWELGNVVVESTTAGGTGVQVHQPGVADFLNGFGCGAFSGGTCISSDQGGFINFNQLGGNVPIGPGAIGTFMSLGRGTQMVGSFTAQFLGTPTIGTWMSINGAGTNATFSGFATSGAFVGGGSSCRGPSAFTLGASMPGGAPATSLGCQSL